jgi:signal transduction histidine kinase
MSVKISNQLIDLINKKLGIKGTVQTNLFQNKVGPKKSLSESMESIRKTLPKAAEYGFHGLGPFLFLLCFLGIFILLTAGFRMFTSEVVLMGVFLFISFLLTLFFQFTPKDKESAKLRWILQFCRYISYIILLMTVTAALTLRSQINMDPTSKAFSVYSLGCVLLTMEDKSRVLKVVNWILVCLTSASVQVFSKPVTETTDSVIDSPILHWSITGLLMVISQSLFIDKIFETRQEASVLGEIVELLLSKYLDLIEAANHFDSIPSHLLTIEGGPRKQQPAAIPQKPESEDPGTILKERLEQEPSYKAHLAEIKPSELTEESAIDLDRLWKEGFPSSETKLKISRVNNQVGNGIFDKLISNSLKSMVSSKKKPTIEGIIAELNYFIEETEISSREPILIELQNLCYSQPEFQPLYFDVEVYSNDRSRMKTENQLNCYILIKKQRTKIIKKSALKEKRLSNIDKNANSSSDQMSVVVHDMRSPLMCIQNNLEMLDRELKNNEAYDEIAPILKSSISASTLLETLVSDILDSARISQGIFKIVEAKFNLKNTVQECLETLKIAAKARKNKLFMNYEGNEIIISDRQRIKQVLLNFLSNSIKFTKEGQIDVDVRQESEWIQFTIKDTGAGISKEKIEDMFEKYQSDRSKDENSKGIGLGLFICKSLIDHLGPPNNIFIQSELGVGTQIIFRIYNKMAKGDIDLLKKPTNEQGQPFAKFVDTSEESCRSIFSFNEAYSQKSKEARGKKKMGVKILQLNRPTDEPMMERTKAKEKESNPSELLAMRLKTVRILLMEDDAFIVEALKGMISMFFLATPGIDYIINSFDSYSDTYKFVKQNRVDLAILDNQVEGGNGRQFLEEYMKEFSEATNGPLFVLCTGDEPLKSDYATFFRVLSKPVRRETLNQVLTKTIEWIHRSNGAIENKMHKST